MVHIIYIITDPFTGEIKYVGRTRDLEKRKLFHRYDTCGTCREYVWGLWKEKKIDPVYHIVEVCDEHTILQAEKKWISFCDFGNNLLNKNKMKPHPYYKYRTVLNPLANLGFPKEWLEE